MPEELTKKFIELAGGPETLIVVLPTANPDPLPERPRDGEFLMRAGAKQLGLHGGGVPWDPAQEYRYRDGEMLNGLVVLSFALSDAGPNDGGFGRI